MVKKTRRWLKHMFIPLGMSFLLVIGVTISATEKVEKHDELNVDSIVEKQATKEFRAADMIFRHIADGHDWHILDVGDFHLSIPLPVILWHNGQLHFFMSGKFHHGHELYKGFGIKTVGHSSKIVKADLEVFEKGHLIVQDPNQPTPLDFSITKNVVSIFISVFLLIWIFVSIAKSYKQQGISSPKGLQSALEPLILFIRDNIALPSIGKKKYELFMPFLLTLFFFIFLNNLMGLVPFFPGGANVTGNISVTLVLAAFTLMAIVIGANKHYWMHIFNTPGVPWMLKLPIPLMPVIELVGLIIKPVVLMIRLFANITAGHIIMLSFISLIFIFGNMTTGFGFVISPISIVFAIFVTFIELLVAFIQAYVFTLLSALYFGMAVEEAH
jgi:F-type H+-transporting ATPase subunit a